MALTPRQLGTLIVVVLKAKNLPNKRHIGKQDPYCTVTLNGDIKRTKAVKRGGQHPEWDEEFRFPILEDVDDLLARTSTAGADAPAPPPKDATPKKEVPKAKSIKGGKAMRIQCYADDPRDPEIIGEGVVDLDEVLKKGETDEWFTIFNKQERYSGEVYLELTFWSSEAPPAKKPKPRPSQPEYGGPGTHTSASDLSLSGRPSLPSEFSSSDSLRSRNASGATVVPDSLRPSGSLESLDLYKPSYEQVKPDGPPPLPPLPPGAFHDGYDEFGGNLVGGRRGESMPARGGQRPVSLYEMPTSQSLSSHHMHQPSLTHWDSTSSLADSFSHMSMSSPGHDVMHPRPSPSPIPRPHSQSFSSRPIPESLRPHAPPSDASWLPPRPNSGFQPISTYAHTPYRGPTPVPMPAPAPLPVSASLQLPQSSFGSASMPPPARSPSPYAYPPQAGPNYGAYRTPSDTHPWSQYPPQNAPGSMNSPPSIPQALPPAISPPRAPSARPLPSNPQSPTSQYPPPHHDQASYGEPPTSATMPIPASMSYYGGQPVGQPPYPPVNAHSPVHSNSLPSPEGTGPPSSGYPLPPPPQVPHRANSLGPPVDPPAQQYPPQSRPPMVLHATSDSAVPMSANGPPPHGLYGGDVPRPVSSMSYHQLPPSNYQQPPVPHPSAPHPPYPSAVQTYQQPPYGQGPPSHPSHSASSYPNLQQPWNTIAPPPNPSYLPPHASYAPPPMSAPGFRPPYSTGPAPPAPHYPPPPPALGTGPPPPRVPDYPPPQLRQPLPQSSFAPPPPPLPQGFSAVPPDYGRPAPPPLPANYGPPQQQHYPPHDAFRGQPGPPPPLRPSSMPFQPGQGTFSPPPPGIAPGARPLPPVSPYRNQ